MAVMAQHLNGTAPRLDRVNPVVSPQLAAIVARCLARNPADRYADMDALIDALDHPENADLAILDKVNTPSSSVSLLQLQSSKAFGIAFGILAIIVIFAWLLQVLRQ